MGRNSKKDQDGTQFDEYRWIGYCYSHAIMYNLDKNKELTEVNGNTCIGSSQSITLPANSTGDEV